MTFVDLVNGEHVFVDANTFIYHFAPHPKWGPACNQLLERIERQELVGYTAAHVVSEVAHRLMTFEAGATFGWKSKVLKHLKQSPAATQSLTRFRQSVERIPQMGVHLLDVRGQFVLDAAAISQQTGLLHNDALIVAVMRHHGLANLASEDADFDRVPGITRYAPA